MNTTNIITFINKHYSSPIVLSHNEFNSLITNIIKHFNITDKDIINNLNITFTGNHYYIDLINTIKYKKTNEIYNIYSNLNKIATSITTTTTMTTMTTTTNIKHQEQIFSVIINNMIITKQNDIKFGPFSTQWTHDIQIDDDVSDIKIRNRYEALIKLRNIKYPEQRSKEWFNMRESKITASDAGLVVGDNKYEKQYKFIVKKIRETFQDNEFTYHGKKFERIATMIYEYRNNVLVNEFGMVPHPNIKFFGASPDGIVSEYKLDGIHRTNLVGRMLEIKCPYKRIIKKVINDKEEYNSIGEILQDGVCPAYYWHQCQQQLYCCELDECDFWQCDLKEYSSKEEFIADTHDIERFRTKHNFFEKGCLIQLLPKTYIHNEHDYEQTVFKSATFLHPPSIVMTPEDCEVWITSELQKLDVSEPNKRLDRIVYWYLNDSYCRTLKKDNTWMDKYFNIFQKMWNRVEFIRKHENLKKLYLDFCDNVDINCGLSCHPRDYKMLNKIKYTNENLKNNRMLDIIDNWMLYINNTQKLNDYNMSIVAEIQKYNKTYNYSCV